MTHKEKLRLAGIRRYGSEKAWREAQARNGQKGGKAKGESKRRGDSDYYSRIGRLGGTRSGEVIGNIYENSELLNGNKE